MSKKKILLISLVPIMIITTIIVTYIKSIEYYKYYGQFHEDAKRVNKVSENYISIKNMIEDTNGKLRWVIWHSSISFKDSDNITIYSTSLGNNSSAIVKYKGEYYIDELLYDELMVIADGIAEQRNRMYNLGNAVILRGHEVIPYVIIVDSVETEIVGEVAINTIKFRMERNISEDKINKIFSYIETDNGTRINEFTLIDKETVEVRLPVDEEINMILLKSPDFESCNSRFEACNNRLLNGCCFVRRVNPNK